ncbi:MAG TPA: hypothetical protein VJV78_00440, partial [Polyangiales bacterium]|nr:hypothetical protein [Polyangiales bacterium]
EVKVSRGSDFYWFLASRIGALAIAVAAVAIFVSDREHDQISEAKAVAVHKAELASRMRKLKPSSATGMLTTAVQPEDR